MTTLDENQMAVFNQVRIFSFAFLIFAPLVYLALAFFVEMPLREGGEYQMMLYILLIVGAFQPFVLPIIERTQVAGFRKNPQSKMTPEGIYTTMSIIRFAFIEAIYLYGLLVFFLSGDRNVMLYFYPIGIVWSCVQWPTQAKFENFLDRIKSHAINE